MNGIVCREMQSEDISTLIKWIAEYYGGSFPADFFPKTGCVASIDNVDACIIPVYLEQTSSVAVLGHCIVNADLPKRQIAKAVKACIDECTQIAKRHNRKYAVAIFGRNSINRIADRCGFMTTDSIEEKYIYIGD